LGPSWEHLGASLAILSDFGALLDHFWGHLGPFWALLGAFFDKLVAILGYLRPSWEQELFENFRPDLPVGGLRRITLFWGPKFTHFLFYFGSFF
jgi:hypothetical protein